MLTVSSGLHAFRAILRIAYVRMSWRSLLLLLAILNTKSIPLAWHFRLAYHFIKNLRFRADRPLILYANDSLDAKERPTHPIFTAASIYSHSGLMETDYNMHKSNSTYFSDLDISRTALMTRIYSPGLTIVSRELDQSASTGDCKPLKKSSIYIALGSVFCSFKQEIKPYECFEIRTQIAGWDEKWVYTLSYFLRPEKKKGEGKTLLAIGISKYVVKKGRLTVPPERVFRASGFLPPRPDGFHKHPIVGKLSEGLSDTSTAGTPTSGEGITTEDMEDYLARRVLRVSEDQISPSAVLEDQQLKNSNSWNDHEWTWERIDQKRRRGLDIIEGYIKLDTKLYEEWNN
ncbi:hypothetical protein V8E54_000311 [Elaphomyces granulatus]